MYWLGSWDVLIGHGHGHAHGREKNWLTCIYF